MGGHRLLGQWPSLGRCWTGFALSPPVALTGNCNAKNVAGSISGFLRHRADLAVPPAACKKCCWTYFALGRASAAVRNVVGPIRLFCPPWRPRAAAKNIAGPISLSAAPALL